MWNPNTPGRRLYYLHYWRNFKGNILDVGCSTGQFLSNDAGNIFGVDVDRDAIRVVSKSFKSKKVAMGDAISLPFSDNSFDGVNSYAVIEHFPNPMALVKEMLRVLRRGGAFGHKYARHIFS